MGLAGITNGFNWNVSKGGTGDDSLVSGLNV